MTIHIIQLFKSLIMTIFYNEPREFNFPIEFFLDGETPAKRNCTPSTSRARWVIVIRSHFTLTDDGFPDST